MHSQLWSYKEPLSEHIKSQLESLSQHLNLSEYNHLISDIEALLGTFIQEKKNESNAKNSINTNMRIRSALTKTQQLIVEVNEILSEECTDAVKMHLLENDEDKWLQLKVLELDLPNHLDSVEEILKYLNMLDSLKDVNNEIDKKRKNPQRIFFSQLNKVLIKYKIDVEKQTQNPTSSDINDIDYLYHSIMEQLDITKIDLNQIK